MLLASLNDSLGVQILNCGKKLITCVPKNYQNCLKGVFENRNLVFNWLIEAKIRNTLIFN